MNIGDVFEQHHAAIRCFQRQLAHLCRALAQAWRQHHRHVEDAIPLVHLAYQCAGIGGFDRTQSVYRSNAEPRQGAVAQMDDQLRAACRRLHLHCAGARHAAYRSGDFLGLAVEHVEVVAIDVHHHWRGIARNRFMDAFGEKGIDREARPHEGHNGAADGVQHALLSGAREWGQVDLELASKRTGRIRYLGGPSRALGHRMYPRNPAERSADALPQRERLGQRRARRHFHVDDEMPLAQRGQEAALHERQHGNSRTAQQHHDYHRRAGALVDIGQQTGVMRLEPFAQRRFLCLGCTAR